MANQIPVLSLAHMEDLMPLIREILNSGKSVRILPRGISMLPMLRQGIDSVVLSPAPQTLKKYDLPLYRRDDGRYILHRVIGVSDTYTCMGDNQFEEETGVRRDQILALVTGFYRGENYHSVEEPLYRLYCRLWHYSLPVRHFLRRGTGWLHRKWNALRMPRTGN